MAQTLVFTMHGTNISIYHAWHKQYLPYIAQTLHLPYMTETLIFTVHGTNISIYCTWHKH